MLTAAAVSEVRRAARGALRAEAGQQPRWQWRDRVPSGEFLAAVVRHRVAPLLAAYAEELDLPPALAHDLGAVRDGERMAALSQLRRVATVSELLAGIDHLFLKGAALAVQTTGDPTSRGGGDVDVLVRPTDLATAQNALIGAGWLPEPDYTVDPTSWLWRYQRWVTWEIGFTHPSGAVDLHWRLDPTHRGLADFEALWARHEPVALGASTVATLSIPDAFTHSLHHAAKDGWESLRSLVDVHRLARDPKAWPAAPDRVQRATLTVTDAMIGLTPTPGFAPVRSALPRALASQADPVRNARFPGERLLRMGRYRLTSSATPGDVAATVCAVLLPPANAIDVDDEHARTALPRLIAGRIRRVGWRLSGWRTDL